MVDSMAPVPAEPDAAAIWALELEIYTQRAAGNLKPYIESAADGYLAWPPFRERPAGAEGLREVNAQLRSDNQEQLEASFIGFAREGDAAVIYYRTHRTRRPDGTSVDEHFDVIHSWVLVGGRWRVLGGMARASLFPPPAG